MDNVDKEERLDDRPHPHDFINFLPWACVQYNVESTIAITKVVQNEYVSVSAGEKVKKTLSTKNVSRHENISSEEKPDAFAQICSDSQVIQIFAYCDFVGNLVELKFDNNIHIPCAIFQIITFTIKYYVYLTRITINSGVDQQTIYEMNKFLCLSNITEICLDNTFFPEANYDLLLDNGNKIRYLSLARCRINDTVLENISKKLVYPLPASKYLTVLILASNRITDKGVVCLTEALRSNRQLSYISLAGNNLTDDGVLRILNTLTEFPLTEDDIISEKIRHVRFIKDKSDMINNMVKELRSGEYDKKISKKKAVRQATAAPSVKKGKLEREGSLKSFDSKSNPNWDYMFYDKAVSLVEEQLGEFSDPFSSANTLVRDTIKYCYGNNAVTYLNLAYNNLSYISLKELLNVFTYQKEMNRKPRGLVNVCVEGNDLPILCKELSQIDDAVELGLMQHNRKTSMFKKTKSMIKQTPH